MTREYSGREIAIIGIACRFPQSPDWQAFWQNLLQGKELISFFSEQQLLAHGVPQNVINQPNYVPAKAYLEDGDCFDAPFFGYSSREANKMDPQLRILHEVTYNAFVDAGVKLGDEAVNAGVFLGSTLSPARLGHFSGDQDDIAALFDMSNYNDPASFATQISYRLKLDGPSLHVQTACSTSLSAVHLACKSLLAGECEMAIAGGACITDPNKGGYLHQEGMILSPDGHCRTFDKDGEGTVNGNGVGVVLLKLLDDAIAAGDPIHAVILESGMNNDADRKVSFEAPSVKGQAEAISMVYELAEVPFESLGMIEAHGTATKLGDPIEVQALNRVAADLVDEAELQGFECAIGSVKSNMGHLDAAAGIAGLIKAALSVRYAKIPPSLHFNEANPHLALEETPFFVPTQARPWQQDKSIRRASVSSFGIGGTNVHVLLEQAPETADSDLSVDNPVLLPLSADSPDALRQQINAYQRHATLESCATSLRQLARQVQQQAPGRCRAAFAVRNANELSERAQSWNILNDLHNSEGEFSWVFPGQGSHVALMGETLAEHFPAFRHKYFALLEMAAGALDLSIEALLAKSSEAEQLTTLYAQPLLYAFQSALGAWLLELGIQPQALVGFSLGEWAAASIAGVFSAEQGMGLVIERARLMEETPAGALFTLSKKADTQVNLPDFIWRVCELNPRTWTIACAQQDREAAIAWLSEHELTHRPVPVSHAFHTPLVADAASRVKKVMQGAPLQAARLPIYSTVYGRKLSNEDMCNPEYWAEQMVQPILWGEAVVELVRDLPNTNAIQIGYGTDLIQHLRKWTGLAGEQGLSLLGKPAQLDERDALYLCLAECWKRGANLDFSTLHQRDEVNGERVMHKVHTPGRAFKRKHLKNILPVATNRSLNDSRFYVQNWDTCQLENMEPLSALTSRRVYLIAPEKGELELSVMDAYAKAGATATFIKLNLVGLEEVDAYAKLAELLEEQGLAGAAQMDFVVTGLVAEHNDSTEVAFWAYWLPTFLARWSADKSEIQSVRLLGLSRQMLPVKDAKIVPQKALYQGPLYILPEEYECFSTLGLDVGEAPDSNEFIDALTPWIVGDWQGAHQYHYTQGVYWRKQLTAQLPKLEDDNAMPEIGRNSWVLITGASGGMGTAIAEHLAETYQCNLILQLRKKLPPRALWADEIAHQRDMAELLIWVQSLEASGARVELVEADLGDYKAMESAFASVFRLCEQGEKIDFVFHTAGRGEGALLQLRDEAESIATLAPKVTGSEFIADHIQKLGNPDVLLFSSLGNLLPKEKVGQIAYVSANACVESYAQYLQQRGVNAMAVAWDDWAESGMATRSAAELDNAISQGETSVTSGTVWLKAVSPSDCWYLDEHRLDSQTCVMPAMAYLALLHEAAHAQLNLPSEKLRLSELLIEAPMLVAQDEQRLVAVVVDQEKRALSLYSGSGEYDPARWTRHVQVNYSVLDTLLTPKQMQRDKGAQRIFDAKPRGAVSPNGALTFGPRWHNIIAVDRVAEDELWLELQLGEDFRRETTPSGLHVALLDTATLVGSPENEDAQYAPMSIGEMTYLAPMTGTVISHVTFKSLHKSKLLQVDLYSPQGEHLVSLKDLMLVDANTLLDKEHKVLRLSQGGEASGSFKFESCVEPRKSPADFDVEIEVKAAGLNFKDVLIALGVVPAPADSDMTYGQEAAGVVSRVGDKVTRFKVGDRVMAAGHSCFAEHVLMPESVVAKMPTSIGYQQASTLPVAFTTAWIALVKTARLRKGERILIHSAASGVGMAALQIAHHLGAEVWATAGTDDKRALLMSMGAKGVATSRSVEFGDAFRAELGDRPFDVVLNALAGELLEESLNLLSPQGRFVELGLRDILENKALGLKIFAAGGSFCGVQAGAEHPDYAEAWEEVIECFEREVLKPLPTKVFGVQDLGKAFEEMAQGKHVGKFAVSMPQANEKKGFVAKLNEEGLSNAEGVEIAMAMASLVTRNATDYLAISKLPLGIVLEKQFETQQMVLGAGQASSADEAQEVDDWTAKSATELLAAMQSLFVDFLDLESADPDTSFFELGATSLDLIQFAKMLEQKMGREIAVAVMFKAASLRALSEELSPKQAAETETTEKSVSSKRRGLKARQKLRKSVTKE